MRRFKNFLRKILNILRLPNLTYTFNPNCDLIHCAHCLSLNKKPWVVDTEVWDRVSAGGKIAESKLGKWIIKNRLESEYCKKIICWSEDCKKSFEKAFLENKKVLDKIEKFFLLLDGLMPKEEDKLFMSLMNYQKNIQILNLFLFALLQKNSKKNILKINKLKLWI